MDLNNPCNEVAQICNCVSGWTGQYCTQRKFSVETISTKFSLGKIVKEEILVSKGTEERGCIKIELLVSDCIWW